MSIIRFSEIIFIFLSIMLVYVYYFFEFERVDMFMIEYYIFLLVLKGFEFLIV